MFRDLSDFVLDFPFEQYNEHAYFGDDVDVLNDPTSPCLAPVPIIYWQNDLTSLSDITKLEQIPFKFILLTGQSDYNAPALYRSILINPNLVHWFGQNSDVLTSGSYDYQDKFSPIPIGVNCFDHAEALHAFYHISPPPKKVNLLLVNFSTMTNPILRSPVKEKFCKSEGRSSQFAAHTKCIDWRGYMGKHRTIGSLDEQTNQASERSERALMKRASFDEDENTRDEVREMATDIMATPTTKLTHSIRLARSFRSSLIKNAHNLWLRSVQYVEMARYKYIVSPPGHGNDVHRTWEALMVGR